MFDSLEVKKFDEYEFLGIAKGSIIKFNKSLYFVTCYHVIENSTHIIIS